MEQDDTTTIITDTTTPSTDIDFESLDILAKTFYDPQFTISIPDAYESSVLTSIDLEEQALRSKHADLNDAYEAYEALLKKYKFWKNVTE